ncbi:MAG TPA: AsmA family protein [Terriglobales bacterium]|nr:AsmA family protein [Terriglobales bacterium]
MLSRSQKRVVVGAAILVVVVLFVLPAINVNRYRMSVARSLSNALGREVTVQSIEIQTFPQPGLALKGVVVADDPNISAEPMLRADEVLATLHVSSLWRGRLEISTLKLAYPSLNLVRSYDGRWNVESLFERARQTPTAPTAQPRPESRRRFPYIETDGARINLKLGNEKKVFALGEADLGLWLASENEWRLRLEARPIRTDANLSDTGTLKMEGSLRRAERLSQTPISLKFWWENAQLGQTTTLVYGRDRGWRGSIRASATVQGTPESLKVNADARLEDFRRYDITSEDSVGARARCEAELSLTSHKIQNLYCQSPLGGGMLQARGNYEWHTQKRGAFTFWAENVPTQFVLNVVRHMKKNIPQDVSASGMISASMAVDDLNGVRTWAGNGEMSSVKVQSTVLREPLVIAANRWRLIGPGTEHFLAAAKLKRAPQPSLPQPNATAFGFEPVAIPMGGTSPATVTGWFTRERFVTELKGEAEIERLFQLARLAGLPTSSTDLAGTAKGRLILSGSWQGFALPTYAGEADLQRVTAKLNGVASPLRLQTAHFTVDTNSLALTKAVGSFADIPSILDFSVNWPRNCAASDLAGDHCAATFDIKADQLNLDRINSLLNPKAQKQPWYAALAKSVMGQNRSTLPEIYASGKIAVGKVVIKGVTATRFSSALSITPTGFHLSNISSEVLGGRYSGDVTAEFGSAPPVYESKGKFSNVAFGSISSVMNDTWASGKADASYSGKATGWNAEELASSAAGRATFQWHEGELKHINLDGAGNPLRFKLFAGSMELKSGILTISESKLQTRTGIYQVSGTASLGRALEVKLARDGAPGYSVSGTLERPRVSRLKVPQTEAVLR